MPEGPTLYIVRENIAHFKGKKVLEVKGNARIDLQSLQNKTVTDIRTWGKHLIISFKNQHVRIHFLMFGSYSVDEQTKPNNRVKLSLTFANGSVYFYSCSVKMIDDDIDELYDWEADVLSGKWKPAKAKSKLKQMTGTLACDALLDQQVFSGVGNIIKNEVLFRIRLHPESKIGKIPTAKISALVKEARKYSFDFLKWKKADELKRHWQVYAQKKCPRCDIPLVKKYCGDTKRRTFFCENCQVKYK